MAYVLYLGLSIVALTACGEPAPTPTGSTCPPSSTLTYDNFAAPFMASYCTRCHSSDRNGEERHGAPLYHDFDTLDGILAVADHVDEWAAAGPDSVNRLMPPDAVTPTDAERFQLGEWLACEASGSARLLRAANGLRLLRHPGGGR